MGSRLLRWIKGRAGATAPLRGLLWLVLMVWKAARCLPLVRHFTLSVQVDGHRMRVRAFSYDDLLCASAEYEAAIAHILPPCNGVAVDAGAFIGRHSLAYARAVGPRGRVVAIEPLPANFRLLLENVELNGYSHVTCIPYALGSEEGEAWLSYEGETSTASTKRRLVEHCRVPQQTLDHLLEQLGIESIDLVKIDVEGAELDLLEGSGKILAASPRARLVVEVHERLPAANCPVHHWLAARGYEVQLLEEGQRLFYLASLACLPLGGGHSSRSPRSSMV